jgi:hypothetical protein
LTKRIYFGQTLGTGKKSRCGVKLNTSGKRSFFGKSLSHTTDKDLEPSLISQATQEHAAGVIQRWWKQLHLNQTAIESRHYISQVVSLEQANAKSFSKLETLLLDKDTQTITRNLLILKKAVGIC